VIEYDAEKALVRFFGLLAGVLCVACVLVLALIFFIPERVDDRLYTVEVNGVRHENLTFVWGYKTKAEFKTQDGKRLEVNGTFVVVQQ